MSWPKQIWNWFRRGRLDDGLERELADHLERRAAHLVSQGVPRLE